MKWLPLTLPFQNNRPPRLETLSVEGVSIPVIYRQSERGRRYRLQIDAKANVLVTIPRQGTHSRAIDFLKRQKKWIYRHWQQRRSLLLNLQSQRAENAILFRGKKTRLALLQKSSGTSLFSFGEESFEIAKPFSSSLLKIAESILYQWAKKELVERTFELAGQHQVQIRSVSVRNQRSRWGSCSARGTISLNWRLLQAPEPVRDYIILHELMHRRQMNHSPRFWKLVDQVCPAWKESEQWLKEHAYLLWNDF